MRKRDLINYFYKKNSYMAITFDSFNLNSAFNKALEKENYETPTPIQEEVIPHVLEGKDLLGIAKTGSGKTASYVLPILNNLQNKGATKNRHIEVLVLVPTRELAVQVGEVFSVFSRDLPERLKTFAVYGGVSINPQMIKMQNVNVLVATPGRLLDLVNSKAVHLSLVKTLVLDEADKMLNLGFKKEMEQILDLLPAQRQNLLFSATLNKNIKHIKKLTLVDPVVVKIEEEDLSLDSIEQFSYTVVSEKKGPLLRSLLNKYKGKQVLIFTSSTYQADNVFDKLRKNGFQPSVIHGKKSQGARQRVLSNFKNGDLDILIATDLIGRGIDIDKLPVVINYELPRSPKDYIHRIGRTGRAGNKGIAISLITPEDEHHFKVIQKKMKREVTVLENEF